MAQTQMFRYSAKIHITCHRLKDLVYHVMLTCVPVSTAKLALRSHMLPARQTACHMQVHLQTPSFMYCMKLGAVRFGQDTGSHVRKLSDWVGWGVWGRAGFSPGHPQVVSA